MLLFCKRPHGRITQSNGSRTAVSRSRIVVVTAAFKQTDASSYPVQVIEQSCYKYCVLRTTWISIRHRRQGRVQVES